MGKNSKVHFLTSYVEYLLDRGVRSEEYYVGDASRFIRFLLAKTTEDEVIQFITESAQSPTYKTRLEKTLRKFFMFASENLSMQDLPLLETTKKPADVQPVKEAGRGDTI